jgi:hypothetical protein
MSGAHLEVAGGVWPRSGRLATLHPVPAASPSSTAAQAASPPSIPAPAATLGAWTPTAALNPGNPPTVAPPSPQDEG